MSIGTSDKVNKLRMAFIMFIHALCYVSFINKLSQTNVSLGTCKQTKSAQFFALRMG